MKNFSIRTSYYLLPIFFFVLSLSPNISGDRIGMVLVSVYFLLIPVATYWSNRLSEFGRKSTKIKFSYIDFIAVIFLLGAFYIGVSISWQYLLMQILFVVLAVIYQSKYGNRDIEISWILVVIVCALIFYSLIYIGLNQYSFNNLFSLDNILQSLLGSLLLITAFYIHSSYNLNDSKEIDISKKLTVLYGLLFFQVLTFVLFFYYTSKLKYAIFFAITLLIPLLVLFWYKSKQKQNMAKSTPLNMGRIGTILAACQTLYFLYYFLDTTQVLQAIQGGY